MTKAERAARLNPICQEFRAMSTRLSYALRHRLKSGVVYERKREHNYTITLTVGCVKYCLWFMNVQGIGNGAGCGKYKSFVCLDRKTGRRREITSDPGLKPLGTVRFSKKAVGQILAMLRDENVIS